MELNEGTGFVPSKLFGGLPALNAFFSITQ